MIRRAFAIALLSGAALVFAVRFEPPPTGTIEAEGEIVVVTTITTTTTTPVTVPHSSSTTTSTPPVTFAELGRGVQVVESPLVRMSRGYVGLEVRIFDGVLVDVEMTVVPSESRRAREISLEAHDILAAEAIATQTYRLHNVSGATDTARAWMYALKLSLIEAGFILPPA